MSSLGPAEFTLAATGDSIISRRVLPLADRHDAFAELCSVIDDADASLTNLEVVLPDDAYATPPRPAPDQYQYPSPHPGILMRADPAVLDELAEMGCTLFSAASNHSFDYGRVGMQSTMAELENRGLTFAGLGRTLADARRPSYRETPGGRVGLVTATTSIPPGGEAGPASPIHRGRPGLNPLALRWIYGAKSAQLDQLRELSEALGIEAMTETWAGRVDPDVDDPDRFQFMHMTFEEVDDDDAVGVRYEPYEPDLTAYLDAVADAATRADWVVATLHSHQDANGRRNTAATPAFLEAFARECIDAGADAFVVTGPHVLRGMELYDGRPIFYSLGNFFYQTETIERLPAESFEYYGVDDRTDVVELFRRRYFDEDGNPDGKLLRDEYWKTIVPVCRFEDGSLSEITLYPCTLGQERPLPQRGTPMLATGERGDAILERFESLSNQYGVEIGREGTVGIVDV